MNFPGKIWRLHIEIFPINILRITDGFFKRPLGFFECTKKVLAVADYSYAVVVWCLDCTDQWLGHRPLHLYFVLKAV